MHPLHLQFCLAPSQGLLKLATPALHENLRLLPHWRIDEEHETLEREFHFKNYYQTMAFVNAVAWIAHQQDHHPEMVVNYNRCEVRFTTHAVNGISINDFICAARIDQLNNGNHE